MKSKLLFVYDYKHQLVFTGTTTEVAKYLLVTPSSITNSIKRKTNRVMHHYILENKDDIKNYPKNKEYNNISAWYVIDGIGFRSFEDMVEYDGRNEDEIRLSFLLDNPRYYIYKPTFKGEFNKRIKNKLLLGTKKPESIYKPIERWNNTIITGGILGDKEMSLIIQIAIIVAIVVFILGIFSYLK